jgi:hypothetical protein
MHLFGPLIEAGINYNARWFGIGFSGGIIPFFYLTAKQTTSIVPLLYPHRMEHTQNAFGSPHFYLKLDSIIFKYLSFVLLYDFARLQYDVVDFDNTLAWTTVKNTIITQSLKIEASVLIPAGSTMRFQIGFGYAFESMRLDSYDTVLNKPYLILSAKKI